MSKHWHWFICVPEFLANKCHQPCGNKCMERKRWKCFNILNCAVNMKDRSPWRVPFSVITKLIRLRSENLDCQDCFAKHAVEVCKNFYLQLFSNRRPLNSQGFTVSHTVSLPFSRSYRRFFISHGFSNFKWIFFWIDNFLRKQTRQHNPLSKKYYSIVLHIQKIKI